MLEAAHAVPNQPRNGPAPAKMGSTPGPGGAAKGAFTKTNSNSSLSRSRNFASCMRKMGAVEPVPWRQRSAFVGCGGMVDKAGDVLVGCSLGPWVSEDASVLNWGGCFAFLASYVFALV